MSNLDLIKLVKDNNQATFLFYQMGQVYYSIYSQEDRCFYRFNFDIDSLGNLRINRSEKATTLLKYIREANERDELIKTI